MIGCNKNRVPGFTLVEMLIVVTVVGILSAITMVAYPAVTAKSRVAKISAAAGKIKDGFDIEVASGEKLPNKSFCINHKTSGECFQIKGEGVEADADLIEQLNQRFAIKSSGESSYFNSSDIVFLKGVTIFDLKSEQIFPYVRPAVAYFIGTQTDCANKSAAWYDTGKQAFVSPKPSAEEIADKKLNLQPYMTQNGRNICVITFDEIKLPPTPPSEP